MAQDYKEGKVYEEITKEIFDLVDIQIQVFDYEEFPEKQNEGIDAEIISPSSLKNITLQIKMFQNTKKYGTFPWEVSRYLTSENSFVLEPHKADFHIIIDPIKINDQLTKLIFFIIKTEDLPEYYQKLWSEVVEKYGEPSENNNNWEKVMGKLEPYFRIYYKNETLYQLKLRYTAYQRNVRCFLVKLNNFFTFEINVPSIMIDDIYSEQYDRNKYSEMLKKSINDKLLLLKTHLAEK